jgi:hypothetical protein
LTYAKQSSQISWNFLEQHAVKKVSRNNKSTSARKKAKPRSKPTKKSTKNARKGRLVEAIVALLHDLPGVKVERNVQLPP